MSDEPKQTLNPESLNVAFVKQLSILYNAKNSLITNLPRLIGQATFKNLKHAIEEDLEDSKKQMDTLKEIFAQMEETWHTHKCLAINEVIKEALDQVVFVEDSHYESDMSILFYLSVLENMQLGACKILNFLATKIAYQPYAQLVLECLDISRDNSRLVEYVAVEYFGL